MVKNVEEKNHCEVSETVISQTLRVGWSWVRREDLSSHLAVNKG